MLVCRTCQTKKHIAVQHIIKTIKPGLLKHRMKDIVLWRKDEQFDKKGFSAFMLELALQVKTFGAIAIVALPS